MLQPQKDDVLLEASVMQLQVCSNTTVLVYVLPPCCTLQALMIKRKAQSSHEKWLFAYLCHMHCIVVRDGTECLLTNPFVPKLR